VEYQDDENRTVYLDLSRGAGPEGEKERPLEKAKANPPIKKNLFNISIVPIKQDSTFFLLSGNLVFQNKISTLTSSNQ